MDSPREPSGPAESGAAPPLRALLDLPRLLRGDIELSARLESIAGVVADATGCGTVAISLYRAADDAYEVAVVHGDARARERLLGAVTPADALAPVLDERLLHHGVFDVGDGALFAVLEGAGGRRYGIISVAEPEAGRRPDDLRLDVLGAIAAHTAQALENAERLGQLRSAVRRHRAVIESSLDGVIAIDPAGRVVEFNPAAEQIFGYAEADALGRDLAELVIAPEDREAHRRGLNRGFQDGEWRLLGRRFEVTGLRADGSRLPVELSLNYVEDGGDGQPVVYGFVRDISERRRGEEQLAYLAYHDPLTQLPNRVLVEQQLDLALARARRSGGAVALMFVDLDDFKEVNDRLGHAAGDQLLTGVAARLRNVLRDSDVLARQGGDEFLVLISDLADDPAAACELVAAKLLGALREPFVVGGAEVRTRASIGVSLFPSDAADTESLLRHADSAMYRAKAAGGGRLAYHQPGASIVARRTSVSAQLRRAVTEGELELHYLPVWRLGPPRAVDGVEALLRWRHPERGLLRPAAFLDLAGQSPAADELTDWVLAEACGHAAAWQALGLSPQVGLNISHAQLLAPRFAERWLAAISDHDLEPRQLLVELTESAWTVDAEATLGVVTTLRAAGTSLAIDDFGAGYSSLTRLRELSFDVIKIDRRLLDAVPEDRTAHAVLRAIVELAGACGAELVAEGVESADQLAFVGATGIGLAQGYLFGPPRPAAEMTSLLRRRRVGDRAGV